MATMMIFAKNADNKLTWAIVDNPMDTQTIGWSTAAPTSVDLKQYGTPSLLAMLAVLAVLALLPINNIYIYISHCLFDF